MDPTQLTGNTANGRKFKKHLKEYHSIVQNVPMQITPPPPLNLSCFGPDRKRHKGQISEELEYFPDDESIDSLDSTESLVFVPVIYDYEEDEWVETTGDPDKYGEEYMAVQITETFRQAYLRFKQKIQESGDMNSAENFLMDQEVSKDPENVVKLPKESTAFFDIVRSCYDADRGMAAVADLIKKAIIPQVSAHSEYHLDKEDITTFLMLVKMVWNMPRKEQEHLAPLLERFRTMGLCRNHKSYPVQCAHCFESGCLNLEMTKVISLQRDTTITKRSDLRRLVLDGKHSFMSNLPYPRPEAIDKDSAYVSIKEHIAHLLHWPQPIDFETIIQFNDENISQLYQCPYAQAKLDKDVDYHFIMRIWSDGFQGNSSTKKERFSPWIFTGTLAVRQTSKDSLPFVYAGTFPIALSMEPTKKHEIEKRFYSEMSELDQPGGIPFYHGKLNKFVKVRVSLIVVGCDQPERRKICGLMGVNSVYGPAFGIIGNINHFKDKIPSCDECFAKLKLNRKVEKECPNCLNWELTRTNTDLNSYPAPDGYPEEMPKTQNCQKVTFDLLSRVANTAHDSIVSYKWTDKEALAFLRAHAINTNLAQHGIVANAVRCRSKQTAEIMKEKHPHEYEQQQKFEKANPSGYQKHPHPCIWSSGLRMEQVICVIMHLLFLGIVKTLMEEVVQWLAGVDKNAPFIRAAAGVLEEITDLKLSWCKVLPYQKGTGGHFVSENYVGLAKLMAWFYSMLDKVAPEKKRSKNENEENFPEYDRGNKKCWNLDQCKAWLRHRGIVIPETGGADNVYFKVLELQTRQEGPPSPISEPRTLRKLMLTIQSCYAMISRIMTKEVNKEIIDDCDLHVRIFLSYYSKFDRAMRAGEKKPEWIQKPNFLSLLRIVDSMRSFGPMRLAYEGDFSGEKFIHCVKKSLAGGRRKNWAYNAMTRMLKTAALETILGMEHIKEMMEEAEPDTNLQSQNQKMYNRYSTIEEAWVKFHGNRPLSGILTTSNQFCLVVGLSKSREQVFTLRPKSNESRDINSQIYFQWQLEKSQTAEPLSTKNIERYLLFLPELSSEGFITRQKECGWYTIIDHEWRVLDEKITFVRPKVAVL